MFTLFIYRSSRFQGFSLNWSTTIPHLEKCLYLKLATLINLRLYLNTYNYDRREEDIQIGVKTIHNNVSTTKSSFTLCRCYLQVNYCTDGCFNSPAVNKLRDVLGVFSNQFSEIAHHHVLSSIFEATSDEGNSFIISTKSKTVILCFQYHRIPFTDVPLPNSE